MTVGGQGGLKVALCVSPTLRMGRLEAVINIVRPPTLHIKAVVARSANTKFLFEARVCTLVRPDEKVPLVFGLDPLHRLC